eukprot:PhF_6_TR26152/c0_g1_i1/m.37064
MKFLKHRAKSHNSKQEELIRLFESLGGNLSDDSLSKKQFAEHLKEFGLEFNEMAQVTETGDLMDPEEYDEFTNVKEEKIAPEAATISANHLKDDDVFLEGKKPFSSFLHVPNDSDVHSAGVKSASDDEKDPFQSTLSRRMTERFLDGLMLSSSEGADDFKIGAYFIPAEAYEDTIHGYYFTKGPFGLGYYKFPDDDVPEYPVKQTPSMPTFLDPTLRTDVSSPVRALDGTKGGGGDNKIFRDSSSAANAALQHDTPSSTAPPLDNIDEDQSFSSEKQQQILSFYDTIVSKSVNLQPTLNKKSKLLAGASLILTSPTIEVPSVSDKIILSPKRKPTSVGFQQPGDDPTNSMGKKASQRMKKAAFMFAPTAAAIIKNAPNQHQGPLLSKILTPYEIESLKRERNITEVFRKVILLSLTVFRLKRSQTIFDQALGADSTDEVRDKLKKELAVDRLWLQWQKRCTDFEAGQGEASSTYSQLLRDLDVMIQDLGIDGASVADTGEDEEKIPKFGISRSRASTNASSNSDESTVDIGTVSKAMLDSIHPNEKCFLYDQFAAFFDKYAIYRQRNNVDSFQIKKSSSPKKKKVVKTVSTTEILSAAEFRSNFLRKENGRPLIRSKSSLKRSPDYNTRVLGYTIDGEKLNTLQLSFFAKIEDLLLNEIEEPRFATVSSQGRLRRRISSSKNFWAPKSPSPSPPKKLPEGTQLRTTLGNHVTPWPLEYKHSKVIAPPAPESQSLRSTLTLSIRSPRGPPMSSSDSGEDKSTFTFGDNHLAGIGGSLERLLGRFTVDVIDNESYDEESHNKSFDETAAFFRKYDVLINPDGTINNAEEDEEDKIPSRSRRGSSAVLKLPGSTSLTGGEGTKGDPTNSITLAFPNTAKVEDIVAKDPKEVDNNPNSMFTERVRSAFEVLGTIEGKERNVVFRNDHVVVLPIERWRTTEVASKIQEMLPEPTSGYRPTPPATDGVPTRRPRSVLSSTTPTGSRRCDMCSPTPVVAVVGTGVVNDDSLPMRPRSAVPGVPGSRQKRCDSAAANRATTATPSSGLRSKVTPDHLMLHYSRLRDDQAAFRRRFHGSQTE